MNFEILKKREIMWWIGIITPIVMFAVAYSTLETKVKNQEIKINELEKSNKINELKFTEIQITLAEIRKDIFYIKEKMK